MPYQPERVTLESYPKLPVIGFGVQCSAGNEIARSSQLADPWEEQSSGCKWTGIISFCWGQLRACQQVQKVAAASHRFIDVVMNSEKLRQATRHEATYESD